MIDAIPRRKRLGVVSLILAAVSFALIAVSMVVFTYTPKGVWETVRDSTALLVAVCLLVTATVLQIVGMFLGLAALFRSGDLKVAGFFGLALNGLLLGSVGSLLYFLDGTMSGPR